MTLRRGLTRWTFAVLWVLASPILAQDTSGQSSSGSDSSQSGKSQNIPASQIGQPQPDSSNGQAGQQPNDQTQQPADAPPVAPTIAVPAPENPEKPKGEA